MGGLRPDGHILPTPPDFSIHIQEHSMTDSTETAYHGILLNREKYRPYLDRFDLSEEQKQQLLNSCFRLALYACNIDRDKS